MKVKNFFHSFLQVRDLNKTIKENEEEVDDLKKKAPSDPFSMTKRKRLRRLRNPTELSPENSHQMKGELQIRSCSTRRMEMMNAALAINVGTIANRKPAIDGLWNTFIHKVSRKDLITNVKTSPKMTKPIPDIVNKTIREYEKNEANMIRSVSVLYSGGLMSKLKYQRTQSIISYDSEESNARTRLKINNSIEIASLVEYHKVMAFVKSVEVGELKDFKEFCTEGTNEIEDGIVGVYKELEPHLLTLASLYFALEDAKIVNLLWFGKQNHFKVTIGADGAPFGKDDKATAWLISFMNTGTRVASCYDNFLLCGANCSESCDAMVRYAKKLVDEIKVIESKGYCVDGKQVIFSVELIPSDMKWLSFFSGELNQAAYYFSPFGNVNNENKATLNGSLGPDPGNTWQPWSYQKRIADVQEITQYKKQLTRLKPQTARSKVLAKIRAMGSRQESEPILGKLVDNAYAEPLHNSNNAWQRFHSCLLKEAIERSIIPNDAKLRGLPQDCIIRKYADVLKLIKATRLFKHLRKWVDNGRKNSFEFRFTGKESKCFSHHYMKLVMSLQCHDDDQLRNLRLHVFAYVGMQLREAASHYSRVIPPENYMDSLKTSCQNYFNTVSLFLSSVTPTVCTLGYAIPYHAKLLFEKYGLGLGINTMQGREAKHTMIKEFARHSTLSLCWQHVFRHEFISCIWLRKCYPKSAIFRLKQVTYNPDYVHQDNCCYCGLTKDPDQPICNFCSDPLHNMVNQSALNGELVDQLKALFSSTQE